MTEQTNTDPVEQPVDPALMTGDPPADPPPEPSPEPQRRMIPEDVFIREVSGLRGRARETETALEAAQRTIREQNEMLQRMQARGTEGDQTPPPVQHQPAQQPVQADEVRRLAVELNFQEAAQTISQTGLQTYGTAWGDSVNLLTSLNLNSPDLVGSVMEIVGRDRTHEIMHAIAQDPEKAAQLSGLSPARRLAEITRIAEKMTKPAGGAAQTQADPAKPPARTVSKAPNPPPPVQATNKQDKPRYHDSLSEEEFTTQFNESMARRSARR